MITNIHENIQSSSFHFHELFGVDYLDFCFERRTKTKLKKKKTFHNISNEFESIVRSWISFFSLSDARIEFPLSLKFSAYFNMVHSTLCLCVCVCVWAFVWSSQSTIIICIDSVVSILSMSFASLNLRFSCFFRSLYGVHGFVHTFCFFVDLFCVGFSIFVDAAQLFSSLFWLLFVDSGFFF